MGKRKKTASAFASLIEGSRLLSVPWKNGRGITREIAIYPPSASLAKMDFLWRMSSAEVSQSGPFSVFSDFQRLLTLVQGEELELLFPGVKKSLKPGLVFQFSGDLVVEAVLPKGAVSDLGLIYDPDQVLVKMSLIELGGHPRSFALVAPTVLLFSIRGECAATIYPGESEFQLAEGDTLRIDDLSEERVVSLDPGKEKVLLAAVEVALLPVKMSS